MRSTHFSLLATRSLRRTVAWLLWYVKVATVVLLMTEYNNDDDDAGNGDGDGATMAGGGKEAICRRTIAPTKLLHMLLHWPEYR